MAIYLAVVPAFAFLLCRLPFGRWFRQGEFDQILGKTPNLANIRSVDLNQVAGEPGEDYLRFLMDWYNSIRN